MALTPQQQHVLKEWAQQASPEDFVTFVEATGQQRSATLKAFAKARVDALREAKTFTETTKTELEAEIVKQADAISKYEDVGR